MKKRLVWTSCLLACVWPAYLSAQQDPVHVFPFIADGAGVRAEVALTNPGSEAQQGTIFFWDDDGRPLPLAVEGEEVTRWDFQVAAAGAFKLSTDGSGDLKSGYVTITTVDPRSTLSGTIFYSIAGSQLSVPASPLSTEYHVFAERSEDANSGLAFANPLDQPSTLYLSLHDSQGIPQAARELRLEAGAKRARFIDEIFVGYFDSPGQQFEGTVQAISEEPFAMMGLRQRQDGSLATLSGAPTAFNSGSAQLLLSIDAGIDPSQSEFSGDQLASATVAQLLGAEGPAVTQFVHLENLSGQEPVTVTVRYFNDRCAEVLSFLKVLDCGQSWTFSPFQDVIEGIDLGERFFGPPGAESSGLTALDFGDGRFTLSVTVSGAGDGDSDEALTVLPDELAALSCSLPSARQQEGDPADPPPSLTLCNARPRSFNVLSGYLSGDEEGQCRGPMLRADAQDLFASQFTRMLMPQSGLDEACLHVSQPASCLLPARLQQVEAASCGEGSAAGPAWQIGLSGRPHQLLPLQ
ncbi:MAG TPA: hypothetical protein VLU25_17335 [Acidobacteriota bacterium]|nr:hypothetical protein [Acidobacteriota bacterium]